MHEGLRPADAFDEQHDLARVGIVDDEGEGVGKAEIGLVARRDAIGVAQPPVGPGLHPDLDQAAALEYPGDLPGAKPAQIDVRVAEEAKARGFLKSACGERAGSEGPMMASDFAVSVVTAERNKLSVGVAVSVTGTFRSCPCMRLSEDLAAIGSKARAVALLMRSV